MTEDEMIRTNIFGCSRTDLYLDRKTFTKEQKEAYDLMRARRGQNEPIQYILGNCEFFGIELHVNKNVLIPRPETEIMVELAISKAKSLAVDCLHILDLGTGSGNIPIALSKNIKNCQVVSVDISPEALKVAQGNANRNFVDEKITFVQKDMQEFLQEYDGPLFDVVISNPPYIKRIDMVQLPEDVKQEPSLALDGGLDGLKFYRKIIPLAPSVLKPGGSLYLEIGDGQADEIRKMFFENENYDEALFLKDYVGTERVAVARTQ